MIVVPFLEHFSIAWRQCLRANALAGVVVMGACVLFAAWIFAAFSLRQPLVVALDTGISGIRLLAGMLMLVWVQEAFARDIERNIVLAIFSYPVTRASYVLGRFSGVVGLAGVAIVFWSIGLYCLGTFADWGYDSSSRPLLGWKGLLVVFGIWLDIILIGAFMLLMVSFSRTRLLPLFLGFGFMLAGRGVGAVIGYLRFSQDADPRIVEWILPIVDAVKWVLPDLGSLDWRDLVLGSGAGLADPVWASLHALAYLTVLVAAAVAIYERREFN